MGEKTSSTLPDSHASHLEESCRDFADSLFHSGPFFFVDITQTYALKFEMWLSAREKKT